MDNDQWRCLAELCEYLMQWGNEAIQRAPPTNEETEAIIAAYRELKSQRERRQSHAEAKTRA